MNIETYNMCICVDIYVFTQFIFRFDKAIVFLINDHHY